MSCGNVCINIKKSDRLVPQVQSSIREDARHSLLLSQAIVESGNTVVFIRPDWPNRKSCVSL